MFSPFVQNRRASLRRALPTLGLAAGAALFLGACGSDQSTALGPNFANSPCSVSGTLQLAVAQTARVDCSNGGTTVTVAGNGASYLVVTQLATDQGTNSFVGYHLASGSLAASGQVSAARFSMARIAASFHQAEVLRPVAGDAARGARARPRAAEQALDAKLRARARQQLASGAWHRGGGAPAASRTPAGSGPRPSFAVAATPAVGSLRQFVALSNENTNAFSTVTARLFYAGSSVLVYVDTLAPAGGFTQAQLSAFGQQFDQTFYPIDTAAYGPPSDIDNNGHVIMLMSPTVNELVSATECETQGYVAGYFNEEDLSGGAGDPNSNNGEIFYSVVPDPNGVYSCSHTLADVNSDVPPTFLHETQHLISYAQHVVIHGGNPEFGWLDEGLSIAAEELGSIYYENKFPPPTGRTDPSQLFPDSAEAFTQGFLYDSYEYALLPDTASLTLHDDSEDGFDWRGGDWLLVRWLADQFGQGIFKTLDESQFTGVANIQAATGQSFPTLFANLGLALYTDSLPGLARNTAPAVDRFVSRNVRLLWDRLYLTSGGASDVPLAEPVQLFSVTSDTTTAVMTPGTMSFYRLDTPTTSATVTLQYSGPGGVALPSVLQPQLAIFRLPPGQ